MEERAFKILLALITKGIKENDGTEIPADDEYYITKAWEIAAMFEESKPSGASQINE